MSFIADLHVHSRYTRSASQEMGLDALARWAVRKGIDLIGTGDFTHPSYVQELQARLQPAEPGLFRLKGERHVRFLLTAEVAHVYRLKGRLRKLHIVIWAPSLQVVEKLNQALGQRADLSADGRPLLTFPADDLVKLVLDISQESVLVPAHIWSPISSLFGSASNFRSLEECFGEEAAQIFAVETGLSSDPPMNWRLSNLDRVAILSFSDAHSPSKLGREATVFAKRMPYQELVEAIKAKDRKRILSTIEFFPEEGKYYYDGHRKCGASLSPKETRYQGFRCPVCRRKVTVGVLHRVEDLADRPEGSLPPSAIPYQRLVPLEEIIALTLGKKPGSMAVMREYDRLIERGGSEFAILLTLPEEELRKLAWPRLVEGILRVREGKVRVVPGYDGVFGQIDLFGDPTKEEEGPIQLSLF
ncbi:MAG: DNA helicase UvrD [candidate division NC10 bacterium]|nr:DNA helicase UvrD [candidate division NC10 bacterium]